MRRSKKNEPLSAKKIKLGLIAAILGIVMISAGIMFYQNYLYQLKIVKVENYPEMLPGDMRSNLELQLRNLLELHFEVPENEMIDSEIRAGTYRQDSDAEIVTATFLLDIDAYRQTYAIVMNWSDTVEIADGVLIACPSQAEMKYPDTKCLAMYGTSQDVENREKYPIYQDLPIIVDEFDYASRVAISYEIRGAFNEQNQLVLTIIDYSGGNYEKALERIRGLGYNPDDYIIRYVDESGSF